jgi:TM2 domain-containing membrane protein YozV
MRNKSTATILTLPLVFGIGGLHKFYLGQPAMGLVYLCTIGGFGICQILDLAWLLTVSEGKFDQEYNYRNIHQLRNGGANVTVNLANTNVIGSQPTVDPVVDRSTTSPRTTELPVVSNSADAMQKLLATAEAKGGILSPAQAALALNISPTNVSEVLMDAVKAGYAEVFNDPTTGAVRYKFDI